MCRGDRKLLFVLAAAFVTVSVGGCGVLGGDYKPYPLETSSRLEESLSPPHIKVESETSPDGETGRSPFEEGKSEASAEEKNAEGETGEGETGEEETAEDAEEETAEEETAEEETAGAPKFSDVSAGSILTGEQIAREGEDSFFRQSKITDSVFSRIYGNSYGEDCTTPREDLRYLRLLHYDFDGNIRVGELICNKSVSDDMLRIFRELYKAEYPVEKVLLVDDYGADDELSSSDNNTSCFNYRTVAGTSALSRHAAGVAIDINPLYNPYVTQEGQKCSPANGSPYMDRSKDFAYKIDENDLCYRLFTEAGFVWGGDWSQPDYMHFSRDAQPER